MSKDDKPLEIPRDANGRFLPGYKGKGRKKGTRNKFKDRFIEDFAAIWNEHGMDALLKMCHEKPGEFVRAAVQLYGPNLDLEGSDGQVWVLNATPALDNSTWLEKHGISQDNQQVIEHSTSTRKDN